LTRRAIALQRKMDAREKRILRNRQVGTRRAAHGYGFSFRDRDNSTGQSTALDFQTQLHAKLPLFFTGE